MPASSILPVAIYKNKLYFLFGKENPMEDSAHGFSDFGGGIDKGETPMETAIREGAEELTGFLGNPSQIKSHLKKHGYYKIEHIPPDKPHWIYHSHIVHYNYDPNLPKHYNNNHEFLWNRMDKKMLNKTKLFEKIKIEWFCEDELLSRKSEYRHFYFPVVEKIVDELPKIREFIKKCHKKHDINKCKTNKCNHNKCNHNKCTYNKSRRKTIRKIRGGK